MGLLTPEDDPAALAHRSLAEIEQHIQGCTHDLDYDEDYDGYYCVECNIWMEPICGDRRCTYCAARPVVPSLTPTSRSRRRR